jgi:hypothetical protein
MKSFEIHFQDLQRQKYATAVASVLLLVHHPYLEHLVGFSKDYSIICQGLHL